MPQGLKRRLSAGRILVQKVSNDSCDGPRHMTDAGKCSGRCPKVLFPQKLRVGIFERIPSRKKPVEQGAQRIEITLQTGSTSAQDFRSAESNIFLSELPGFRGTPAYPGIRKLQRLTRYKDIRGLDCTVNSSHRLKEVDR